MVSTTQRGRLQYCPRVRPLSENHATFTPPKLYPSLRDSGDSNRHILESSPNFNFVPTNHLIEHAGVHERGPAFAVRGIEIHRELFGVLLALALTAAINKRIIIPLAAAAAAITIAIDVADQHPQASQVTVCRGRHDRRPPRRVRPRRLRPLVEPDRVEQHPEGGEVAARRGQEGRRPPGSCGDERVRPPGE